MKLRGVYVWTASHRETWLNEAKGVYVWTASQRETWLNEAKGGVCLDSESPGRRG